MTRSTPPESMVDRDWGTTWETLPPAPPIIRRPKSTQVTLRVPPSTVERLRAVATARSLPYHALARSWIVDGLRSGRAPGPGVASDMPKAAQLNLKVDHVLLDDLKRRAAELRRPYHALARELIEAALLEQENDLSITQANRAR